MKNSIISGLLIVSLTLIGLMLIFNFAIPDIKIWDVFVFAEVCAILTIYSGLSLSAYYSKLKTNERLIKKGELPAKMIEVWINSPYRRSDILIFLLVPTFSLIIIIVLIPLIPAVALQ